MYTMPISELPRVTSLADTDDLIVNQTDTSRAELVKVKEYMQGDLPDRINNAINEVKEYADQQLSGRNEWLPPVNKVSELTTAGLDNKINYLCKVVADTESGVYQCVAGWEDEPVWELFDNTVDLVNEQELENGITAHNIDTGAHEDIRTSVSNEAQARAQGDSDTLNSAKSYADGKAAGINSILDGVKALTLEGEILTRVINGTTPVAKNLFDPFTFVEDRTLIGDINGTVGVVRGQDSAEITVETLSVSPMSSDEPTLLGNVNTFADLPETVEEAIEMGWNTPRIDDYARVLRDETNDNATVEWYIEIIVDGVITWANPVILNTSDYQAQTTANDAGKVLTGGASAGTFGVSLAIDTEPTENSNNLINSNAVFALMKTVFLLSHPVESIYLTVSEDENTAVKMENKYGGTWAAWGQGRVPVGVNSSGTFNTVEKTGGAENHTLTTNEMPSHNHTQASHTHSAHTGSFRYDSYAAPRTGVFSAGADGLKKAGTAIDNNSQDTVTNMNATHDNAQPAISTAGNGASHNNLQPYITCYMYKRTA